MQMENEIINDVRYDLSVAIPKGYLFNDSVELLSSAGMDVTNLSSTSRKLFSYSEKDRIKYVISRPMDVPVYVEQGACDMGFAGKDVLLELDSNIIELMDLKNGKCRMIIATLKDRVYIVKEKYRHFGSIKVATKYPNIAKKHFDQKGMQVEIVKLYGSVELAPLLGIAEEILDITATGNTLRENNLVEMETLFSSTTRLIANMVSYRLKFEKINEFTSKLKAIVL